MYLYLVFNKSAYRSLIYLDIILFVKTIFDFKQFFLAGYPANGTGRILDIKKPGYPVQPYLICPPVTPTSNS